MEGNKVSILCPYDAELFGHWWFEGPLFIEKMFERAASSSVVEMASLEDSIREPADKDVHKPIFSSWGEGGFGEVWMNDEVTFQYPMFFRMRKMMDNLKSRISNGKASGSVAGNAHGSRNAIAKRFLAQMARELVLFQASDWAFMIHNNSAADYARARLNGHYENVCALYREAVKANPDMRLLKKLEQKNNLFPWIGALV